MTDDPRYAHDVDCPECGAPSGQWCRRHGTVQAGLLLCCAARGAVVARLNDVERLPYNGTAGYVDRPASVERAVAEAADGIASERQRTIYETVARRGYEGATWREIEAQHPRLHHGQISGALSCLHLLGVVFAVAARRNGCHPYVATVYRSRYLDADVYDRPVKSASSRRLDAIKLARDLLAEAVARPTCPREVRLALDVLDDV